MTFDKKKFLAETERVLHADYACDMKSAGKKELYNAVCDREYQEKQELQMLVDHYDAAVGYLDMNF